MEDNILIGCCTTINGKKETWKATLKTISNHDSYYEAIVEARCTSLSLLVGSTDDYNWVALPIQEVSCSLSSFNDIFWNQERLSQLISPIDASTVAYTIAFIEKYKDILLDSSFKETITTHSI